MIAFIRAILISRTGKQSLDYISTLTREADIVKGLLFPFVNVIYLSILEWHRIKHEVTSNIAHPIPYAFLYTRTEYGITIHGSCLKYISRNFKIFKTGYLNQFSSFWQVCSNWYASQKFEHAESKIKAECRVLGIVNNVALDHCPTISLTYCTVNGNSYDLRTKGSL